MGHVPHTRLDLSIASLAQGGSRLTSPSAHPVVHAKDADPATLARARVSVHIRAGINSRRAGPRSRLADMLLDLPCSSLRRIHPPIGISI